MKKTNVPAAALLAAVALAVPATAFGKVSVEPYDPVKTLREGRASGDRVGLPEKKRDDTLSFAVAPEYFFDFGNDLPDADGWGVSLALSAHFDTDRPDWDFVVELEMLAFRAKSGKYNHDGHEVSETVHSLNILPHFGLSYSAAENFRIDALLGFGIGAIYDEVSGDGYDTSSRGNITTTLGAKLRGEYRINKNWGLFAAYRFTYTSPTLASKLADWQDLDLFTHSVELGVRYLF